MLKGTTSVVFLV